MESQCAWAMRCSMALACWALSIGTLGCGVESAEDSSRGFRIEGTEPGDCDDGADNDADGLFDCDDTSCAASPICADGGAGGAGGTGGQSGTGVGGAGGNSGTGGAGGQSGTGGVGGSGGNSGTGGAGGQSGTGGVGGSGGSSGTGGAGGSMLCAGVDCDDQNECTEDTCDPMDGTCGYTNVTDGTSCDFGGLPGLCSVGTCTATCQNITVTPTRSIPNVMLLVDQSGSMDADFGGGENRWEAANSAINSIVASTDSIVRYGLTTYTSDDGNVNPPCPRLPTQIDFALDNSVNIGNDTLYPYTYPPNAGTDTPTGDSIDALVGSILSNPPANEGPTIIVLATDGAPDSCEYPDPTNGTERAQAEGEAVTAAGASHGAGIDLFVLWLGTLTDTAIRDHLQEVANEGVGLPANGSGGDAQFWVGDDPQSLEDGFRGIISDSISCDVQIDKRFDNEVIACDEGDVRVDGVPLACSDTNGWQVKSGVDDVIELLGSACDTFKSGDVTFSAEFPCGAIIVD